MKKMWLSGVIMCALSTIAFLVAGILHPTSSFSIVTFICGYLAGAGAALLAVGVCSQRTKNGGSKDNPSGENKTDEK